MTGVKLISGNQSIHEHPSSRIPIQYIVLSRLCFLQLSPQILLDQDWKNATFNAFAAGGPQIHRVSAVNGRLLLPSLSRDSALAAKSRALQASASYLRCKDWA